MDKLLDEAKLSKQLDMPIYEDNWNSNTIKRDFTPRLELQTKCGKITDLESAIKSAGLKDGMTISFHHHFRNGDKILNMVMDKLAGMGFKNLQIAPSSLSEVHSPLIKHIQNGVVTRIQTSGLRGELAEAISHGLMENPVIFRSHGGRAAAIANKQLHIDLAFIGASSCDYLGNANGYSREKEKSICGSLGYAKVDAEYADKVIILTDSLVAYPNVPVAISEKHVDYIVSVEEVGDATKIASGAIKETKNPHDILIAQTAAQVVEFGGFFYDGFSLQTGSGGASLACTQYIREAMIRKNVKARFALGGITSHMVQLHEEGLIGKLLDVQSFDMVAARSLKNNRFHQQICANIYANPYQQGSAIHWLDVVMLSALEVDVNFNVNVLTGSDGVIRGAIGGHPDTACGAALSIVLCPLTRGRIPCVVEKVTTLITPGSFVDVIVTDQGVAVNPARPEVAKRLKKAGIKIVSIEDLKAKAEKILGKPDELPFGDKVVGVVTSPDNAILDLIYQIKAVEE
ncbi:MAG: citrate lyase subunit alpha [Clostridia bacterium]